VRANLANRFGGGIFERRSTVTLDGSSSVRRNTADADDVGQGAGGGIFSCGGELGGAIDGGNVNDNHRGSKAPVEDNIAYCT